MKYFLGNYKYFVEQAINHGWVFRLFDHGNVVSTNSIYLRFDVDYELESAKQLARLNHQLGITATFFVQLDSQFYNLFGIHEHSIIDSIMKYNQKVGIHLSYDYLAGYQDKDVYIRRVFKCVRGLVHKDIKPILAWHNPPSDIFERDQYLLGKDIVNVYAKEWSKDIRYISDSNQRNNPSDLLSLITSNTRKSFQLLLHPIIWVIPSDSMMEVLTKVFRRRVQRLNAGFRNNNSKWRNDSSQKILCQFEK